MSSVVAVPDPTRCTLGPEVTLACRDGDCYWRTTEGYVVSCGRNHRTAAAAVGCSDRYIGYQERWEHLGYHPAPHVLARSWRGL